MLVNHRFYYTLLLGITTTVLLAQNDESGVGDLQVLPFAREFQGMVGEQQPVVMVLVNWGDSSLTGSCQYLDDGRHTELYGNFKRENKFTIKEYGDSGQRGVFTGSFISSDSIAGLWVDSQGGQELPFALRSSSDEGTASPWKGTWYLNDPWDEGRLIIGNVRADSLHFGLMVVRGAHLGQVEGRAVVKGNEAFFSNALFGEKPCQFSFTRGEGYIDVEQLTGATACGFGIRAHANGRFENEFRQVSPELSVGGEDDAIFRTPAQRDSFRRLVGEEFYQRFAYNMQGVVPGTNIEGDPPDSRIVKGVAIGLYATNQAIMMHDDQGNFWGLTTDFNSSEELVIQYVTNALDWQNRLPPNLEAWYQSTFEGVPLYKQFFPPQD